MRESAFARIAGITTLPHKPNMATVFVLHHVRSDSEFSDDAKLIGVYSSEENAKAARDRLKAQPGFKDYPNGWDIGRYPLDKDHWQEGFVTVLHG